ncbi:hypothetical protein [Plesiocystis pacifica]|nr:hypothetical protein [Plesiocystis pacifica]
MPTQEPLDAATALALRYNPPRLGRLAMARRRALFGDAVLVRARPTPSVALEPGQALAVGPGAALTNAPFDARSVQTWVDAALELDADASLLLPLEPRDAEAPARYVEGLLALAEALADRPAPASSLAPYCTVPAGTFRLWAIAVARLLLPAGVRVEARHDLVGIRVAQIALGFGADTLSGPIEADRALPIAGVTRPNEATRAGLFNLVEQAGLRPTESSTTP